MNDTNAKQTDETPASVCKRIVRPVAVTIGWDGKPHLCLADGKILWGDAEKIIWPEYWEKDWNWPHDPITGEKMLIYRV